MGSACTLPWTTDPGCSLQVPEQMALAVMVGCAMRGSTANDLQGVGLEAGVARRLAFVVGEALCHPGARCIDDPEGSPARGSPLSSSRSWNCSSYSLPGVLREVDAAAPPPPVNSFADALNCPAPLLPISMFPPSIFT